MYKKLSISRSFAGGFADGFASPFLVLGSSPTAFTYHKRNIVRSAWLETGKHLAAAIEVEAQKLDKAAAKARKTSTKARDARR